MDVNERIAEQEGDLLCMIEEYARSGALEEDKEVLAMAIEQAVQPIVIEVDELVHTTDHPFCGDWSCPCHSGATWEGISYQNEYCEQPFDDGLLTVREKDRLYTGLNV